jgi:formate hydrogenlyase subunit 4
MDQVNAKRTAIFVVAACLIGMVVGSAVTLAVLNVQMAIPSSGLVVAVNVGVYSDAACTLNLTSIDWGSVYPGGSVSRTIYVKNTGNVPMTLSMITTAWTPASAAGQINVTWDKENATLNPGQSTSATLTLTVSPSISGITSFSANIVITGSG